MYMTEKVKATYKSALKNKEFLNQIYEADGDKKPGLFSNDIDKVLFTSIYYGWLVGQYGINWKEHL